MKRYVARIYDDEFLRFHVTIVTVKDCDYSGINRPYVIKGNYVEKMFNALDTDKTFESLADAQRYCLDIAKQRLDSYTVVEYDWHSKAYASKLRMWVNNLERQLSND